MKVLIIEDEKLSAELLEQLLLKIEPTLQILAKVESIKKARKFLEENAEIELIFLDIHLSDGLSFELFENISLEIPVIFTTAYHEYAIQSFEVNNVDYLLKPIGPNDLKKALDKVKALTQLKNKEDSTNNLAQLIPYLQTNFKKYKNRFLVKMGEQIFAINTNEIHHFIAEDGIVLLHTNSGKRYPIDFTLDQLEALIDPTQFFRINRKIIIHLNSIQKMHLYFNSRIKINSEYLPEEAQIVSRERVSEFKIWMEG